MTILLTQILEENQRGFLLLPGETLIEFKERLDRQRELNHQMNLKTQNSETFLFKDKALLILKELYDIYPIEIPITFSTQQLFYWEGACTWIESDSLHKSPLVFIQMHPRLVKASHCFGLYNSLEILVHEYVHACRCRLDFSKYEECFAYYASKVTRPFWYFQLRALLGPLFLHSKEALFFLSFIALDIFGQFMSALYIDQFSTKKIYFHFLPLFYLIFLLIRLYQVWHTWFKCKNRLDNFLKKSNASHLTLPIMVRLTDEEIEKIATLSFSEIKFLFEDKKKVDLRWGIIKNSYFPHFNQ